MSDESSFAPAPFNPTQAAEILKRQLRDLRLAERGNAFELKGQSVVQLELTPSTIEAKLAKRPQRTPEWTSQSLRSSLDVRRFADSVKQRLSGWSED